MTEQLVWLMEVKGTLCSGGREEAGTGTEKSESKALWEAETKQKEVDTILKHTCVFFDSPSHPGAHKDAVFLVGSRLFLLLA